MVWWQNRYNALTGQQTPSDSGGTGSAWWSDRYDQAVQLETQRQQQIQQPSQVQPTHPVESPTFFQRAKNVVSDLFGKKEEKTDVAEIKSEPTLIQHLWNKLKIGTNYLPSIVTSGAGITIGNVASELSEDSRIAAQKHIVEQYEKQLASGDTTEYKIPVRLKG